MKIKNLSEIVKFNSSFKTAVNLYLSLNKVDKVLNYIPTKSSIVFMDSYLQAILSNKEHATLMIGPYGKGKSHLLLVLLAILSMDRNIDNLKIINRLKNKIKSIEEIGNRVASHVDKVWKGKKYLPVIINSNKQDLNQVFLVALNTALKREGLMDLAPETYFSSAIERIEEWRNIYPDTFNCFCKQLFDKKTTVDEFISELKEFSTNALEQFKEIYPNITSGSTFNPLVDSDVVPLYKSVSEKLVEDYNYSGIYIVFDEFSKFIESIDGNSIGSPMKLIQDMCELSSESIDARIYITMVAHKSIKEYGNYLSAEIINAFTGIEGRILEKFFITSSKNNYELIRNAIIKDECKLKYVPEIDQVLGEETCEKYYQLPVFKSNFNREDFKNIILKGCYPLNPLASYLLLNISEKVAQNERTLFTFISNDEPYSMARFVSKHNASDSWSIGADLIYDYFKGIFKKEINNELVHNIWLSAEYAISKCEMQEQISVIKALAIILIVNKQEEMPANEKYLALSSGVENTNDILDQLVEKKIIYKKSSIGAFIFKTRAGKELKAELKKQRELKGSNVNYASVLQKITGKYFILPREYNIKHEMTRYYYHEYMDVDTFLSIDSANVLYDERDNGDGKLISLFSFTDIKRDDVIEHFRRLNAPHLVINVPARELKGSKIVKDFEILQSIRLDYVFIQNNEMLKREIPLLEEDLIKESKDRLEETYSEDHSFLLFWSHGKLNKESIVNEEKVINKCCEEIYYKTPHINNELINKSQISTAQTKKSRLNIVKNIIDHTIDEKFYLGTNQEATIYRALFCGTGVKSGHPDKNINEILNLMNKFIDSCCNNRVSIRKLINDVTSEPYGMRMGVIPCYLAYVLANRKEDLVIYFADMEVQLDADIVVNMCEKSDEYSLYVSREDHLKEQYILKLNELFLVNNSRVLTENRIKNIVICMQRWFRALPQVARNASGISAYCVDSDLRQNMLYLKKMLQKVEYNPFEILFVSIPKGFGVDDLDVVFEKLKACKSMFDNYLNWMIQRTVDAIYEVFKKKNKMDLYHVLKEWYEKQSDLSKQGLHSSGVTGLMSCIEGLNVYSDDEVIQKLVKAVSNVYIENWIDDAFEEFINEFKLLKIEVENIKVESTEDKLLLSFVGSKGNKIEKYYDKVHESTGIVLKNILEDALDEYDDLSVNDRVGILLELIEKIIG